jgi:hypothetical protein
MKVKGYSICFFLVFCVFTIILILSCNSDGPIADIDNLRVELPCLSEGSAPVNCTTEESVSSSTTVNGDEGVSYDVTVRIRGVVEQKTYVNYTNKDGMWIEGGTPDDSSFNIFMLEISSPAQTFYLNLGKSGVDQCSPVDVQKTIVIDNGATVELSADAGGDGLSTKNMDENDDPIVVPGIPPAPDPFEGQFLQLDVINIEVHE